MRNSADIIIHKVDGTEITVPVTAEARRRWRLMEEDSITLSFLTEKAISFAVGDYVEILPTDYTNEEISGTFYITEPIQIPDMTNGVYKYTVRFDNGYIGWKNLLFQLTHNDNGFITRKETDWVLTQNLESHVREVIKNLFVLGIPCNKYCLGRTIVKYENGIFSNDGVIDYPFESAEEYESYKTITYTGTDIFSAIKNGICDAYKCEFWMYNDILCLGKCEIGEAIDFKVAPIDTDKSYFNSSAGKFFTNKDERILVNDGTGAINVESLRPSKSNDKYANRIYAFGSTKNIPYSYRKQLVFTCNESEGGLYRDNLRRLYSPMVKGVTDDREINSFSVVSGYRIENGQVIPAPGWGMTKDEAVLVGETVTLDIAARESTSGFLVFGFDGTSYQSLGASSAESHIYEFAIPEGIESFTVVFKLSNYLGLSASVAGITRKQIQVVYNGARYTAVFNADTSGGWIEFYPTPYGFGIGSKFTIPTEYLNVSEIKDSYYTSDYGDPSSLSHVGDTRLKLPQYAVGDYSGKGFVGDDNIPAEQLVEKVVFFEGIYPQTALRVTDIRIDSGMVTSETYADGSSSRYEVSKYTVKAKLITHSGLVNFPFDRSMIISGQELQIKFLTKEEEESYGPVSDSPHKLAGMTFSVKWNQSDKSYTIRWNQDYGAQIPSEVLCPTIGDSFVLIGWKVNAMSTLGLLDVAELRLLDKAKKYAEAVKEAQATYDCNMMSGWNNEILLPGQKVKVHDETQENGYYTSRVIGYEVKLDIPEDSPVYTIGNTEAYSRLRELEKSLEISDGNVSVTGDEDYANGGGGSAYQQGGGGSILDVWRSLTNDETLESFDEGTEINIDHLPLIPAEKIYGDVANYFEVDNDHLINDKHPIKLKSDYAGIWANGFITAGGVGSSGGSGADLLDVWVSLRDNDDDFKDWLINAHHFPLGEGLSIDQNTGLIIVSGGLVDSVHRYNELGGSFNDNDNDVFNAYTVNKINTDLGARITSLEEGAAVSIVTTGTGNVVSAITKSGTTITVTKGINALTTVPKATDSIIGGFQTGYSESGKNYAVKMSGNKAYVNVPWEEYSLPLAADGVRGGIQIGFNQSGKNYPVQLSNEKAYVNVPWANNTYRLTLNGTERGTTSGTSLGSFYAPTSGGTLNYVLIAGGSDTAPSWTNQSNLSVGTATKLGTSTVGSTTKPIYLNSGTATECSTYAGGTAVTLNGTSKVANTASFYAPTESGTAGYALISGGNNTAPSWTSAIRVSGSNVGIAGAASSSFALNVNGDSKITGDLRLQGSSDYGNHLYFGDGSYAYLYEDTDDHLTIYGNKGIKLDVGSSYGIEFGNGVLKWDSANNAWHLEGNFYADGFVTAGGIGSENTQLVTIAGNQTITGVKTFSSALTLTSDLSVGGDATITGESTFTGAATFNGLATFNGKINIGVQSGYVGITSSNNTIYIQHGVSRDLILTDGSSSHTIIGSYVSPGSYKLYVNGSAKASAWDTSSDRRLKRDIREVSAERAIDVLMRLNPVEWVWNEKNATLEGTRCAGLIAQDTKGVLPFAINDGAEYLGMNYNVFHAYEIAGLQNHEGRIKDLEKENAELKAKVKQLETR